MALAERCLSQRRGPYAMHTRLMERRHFFQGPRLGQSFDDTFFDDSFFEDTYLISNR